MTAVKHTMNPAEEAAFARNPSNYRVTGAVVGAPPGPAARHCRDCGALLPEDRRHDWRCRDCQAAVNAARAAVKAPKPKPAPRPPAPPRQPRQRGTRPFGPRPRPWVPTSADAREVRGSVIAYDPPVVVENAGVSVDYEYCAIPTCSVTREPGSKYCPSHRALADRLNGR